VKMRRIAPAVVGAAALALVVAGCGGGDADKNAANNNTSTGGAATSNQPLTVGMPNGPVTNNSNPFLNTSAGAMIGYKWAIYEPLMQANDTRPANKYIPWLATAIDWNADYTQAKITARDGVKWSDGQAFTADDIAYSLQLRKDNEALNTEGLKYKDIKVDGNVVTVDFEGSQYINTLKIAQLFIVPKHIWEKIADPTKDPVTTPVGTGPYVFKSFEGQTITLDKNPSYWGEKPAVPELRYTAYKGNDALITALQTGEAQWGWTFIPNIDEVYKSKDPAHNTYFFPAGLGIDQLVLNTAKAPFDDVAVRRAVNQVLDRAKASKIAESGIFPELTSVTAIPTPAGDSFISDKYQGQTYKVDVEGAKKTLTDAGYKYQGDKLIGKDGKPVSIVLQDPSGWNDYITSLQLISDSLKTIGITAKVETPNVDTWTENLNVGNFDAALHWTNGGITPYEMYSNMFDPNYYVPVGKTASWNYGRFQNDDAKAAFSSYLKATDDAGRKTALDTLQDIYVDQVPALGVDARPAGAEMSTKYWTGWPSDDDAYANPQPTVPNVALILTKLKPAS